MVTFIHITNNVSPAELSWYEEAILDACCRNIPASDELWYHAVEVSVLLLTHTQKSNPRSPWYNFRIYWFFSFSFFQTAIVLENDSFGAPYCPFYQSMFDGRTN
jgi:hypothetical protein